jgi:endonuclease/exonuclease/phosphatase family metal-dependent hydrolase
LPNPYLAKIYEYRTQIMVTIVSINTWKCDGHYFARLEILEKQLRVLSPHIILMQEVFSDVHGRIHTARHLSEKLGMANIFVPERKKPRWLDGEYYDSFSGLAVLTSLDILDYSALPLPSNKQDGGRSALLVMLSCNGKRLVVGNLHLTHLKDSMELRSRQLKSILNAPILQKGDVQVLGGDFNCQGHSPEMQMALGKPFFAKDTYEMGHGTMPAHTHPVAKHNKALDFKKIDHIIAMPGPEGNYVECTGSSIVLNTKDPDWHIYPSDHFGVKTCLTV